MIFWRPKSHRTLVSMVLAASSICLVACDGLGGKVDVVQPESEPAESSTPPAQTEEITVPETLAWVWTDGDRRGWGFGSVVPEMFSPESGGFGLRAPKEPEFPDVLIRSQPLLIDGRNYDRVLVDIECIIPASKNDLTIYYSTPSHGEASEYRALPVVSHPLSAGERRTLEYDMVNLTAGGSDWVDSRIDKLRFDLPQGAGSEYVIHAIRICNSRSADCK